MKTGRVVLLVAGAIAAVLALGAVVGGGALAVIHLTQRDDSGYYSDGFHGYESTGSAITSESISLGGRARDGDWTPLRALGTVRFQARSSSEKPIFVGIAPTTDVQRYLSSVSHDQLTGTSYRPFHPHYRYESGSMVPAPPTSQTFWAASATGEGLQSATWKPSSGDWSVVVMNADGSPGVQVDATAGINTDALLPVGLVAIIIGLLLAGASVAMIVAAERGQHVHMPSPASTVVGGGVYPVRITGHLDEPLSRGLWLVKWFLAIPHLVVLAVLWFASVVLTVAAGFTILVTGRYPRTIFDFNVGVMRWSWRVAFYAFVLGTDQYPPFTLRHGVAYPANLEVEYPHQLSRGLVLVKSWLLALPHLLIISLFGGGLTWWTQTMVGDNSRTVIGGGLIGLLALIAGVTLLFTKRYPPTIFEFVMGMERWSFRVLTYVALMRDEYPPFRLDNGESEPDPATLAAKGAGTSPSGLRHV